MKHTDRSAAALAERTGGWDTDDGLEARAMFRHVCRAGDEGQAELGPGQASRKAHGKDKGEAHRPMDRYLPPLTCR